MNTRPWIDYYMDVANVVATRSSCLMKKVGAVAVKDRRIIATGYNNPPSGYPHCKKCARKEQGIKPGENYDSCPSVHAELNVVTQAAKHGTSLKNAAVFCTHYPCPNCLKAMINSGITDIYVKQPLAISGIDSSLVKQLGEYVRIHEL